MCQSCFLSFNLSNANSKNAYDAHTKAFNALGGIIKQGIYDNIKTAVDIEAKVQIFSSFTFDVLWPQTIPWITNRCLFC